MKHQVTLDFETEAVKGEVETTAHSTCIQIHFKMSKRYYKPVWKHILLSNPDFTRYLVMQLHAYVENNWSQIVKSSQSMQRSNFTTTYSPWWIFVVPGKNFYVGCSFSGHIPNIDPPPDLNTFLNIPMRAI